MPHATSKEAVRSLRAQIASATERQHQLAQLSGHKLPTRLPRLVAAARIRGWLAEDLGLRGPEEVRDWLERALKALEDETGQKPWSVPENHQVANAWLQYFRLKNRASRLAGMPMGRDDVVTLVNRPSGSEELFLVASINDEGLVWLQGGNGARAWPDQINVIKPKGPSDEAKLRNSAKARIALQRKPSFFGADMADLKEFQVNRLVQQDTIEELRSVVDNAQDEAPIQAYLTGHPELWGLLLRGPNAYVIPQVKLGNHYVADFIIGDVDSNGPRWVLVELETPLSQVTLKNSNEFEQHARKGISQVEEWRVWLQKNLHVARGRRNDKSGCGLAGILPQSDGLVIVGRRHLQGERSGRAADLKLQKEHTTRIKVHTYDWLIEQFEESRLGTDSPQMNDYILGRPGIP